MFKQFTFLQFFAATTLLSALNAVPIASEFATAQNTPENAQPSELMQNNIRPKLLLPEIPPSDVVEYIVLRAKITGRLGLPAAQLADIPAELAQEIGVWVPPKNIEPLRPDEIGTEFISVVRYKGSGYTIYVSTARFTPGAAKLKHTFGKEDKLTDGTTVGFTVSCESMTPAQHEAGYACWPGTDTPNRVVFMRGNKIITVASDLPIDQVKSLATSASLK